MPIYKFKIRDYADYDAAAGISSYVFFSFYHFRIICFGFVIRTLTFNEKITTESFVLSLLLFDTFLYISLCHLSSYDKK